MKSAFIVLAVLLAFALVVEAAFVLIFTHVYSNATQWCVENASYLFRDAYGQITESLDGLQTRKFPFLTGIECMYTSAGTSASHVEFNLVVLLNHIIVMLLSIALVLSIMASFGATMCRRFDAIFVLTREESVMSTATDRQATQKSAEQLAPSPIKIESEALLATVLAAVVAAVAGVIIFIDWRPTIWGGLSLGLAAAGSLLVLGAVAGFVGYWRSRNLPEQSWRLSLKPWKFILDSTTVALVHAMIVAIGSIAVFVLLQRSFQGLTVDVYAAAGGMAVVAGLGVYWIYLSVANITTKKLASLLVVFMAMSVLASMSTTQDPSWWVYHFSQLGTFGDTSAGFFNLALIIAGFFVTTFALYLHRDLTTLVQRRVLRFAWSPKLVSIVFVVMGLMLAGVGIFPLQVSKTLHNFSAAGMSIAFVVLLISSPIVLWGMPKRFFLICAAFVAGLAGSFFLWQPVGYYNLTAFELAAFAVMFGWIALFIRFLSAMVEESALEPAQ